MPEAFFFTLHRQMATGKSTCLQVTLGTWVPVARILQEVVGPVTWHIEKSQWLKFPGIPLVKSCRHATYDRNGPWKRDMGNKKGIEHKGSI